MINGVPRILLVRLSAIGDVARVLPVLHTLRQALPNAQIDWAVERKSAALVEDHPCLDRALVFERPAGARAATRAFVDFCRKVRRSRYDIVMDLHGIIKTGLIAAASQAPDRYAFAPPRGQELSYLFANHRVRLPSSRMNRTEENLALCAAVSPHPPVLDVTIQVPPDVQESVHAYYEQTFVGGKQVVCMHPAVERAEKLWPVEHYARLADLLLADGRFDVLLTWGPGQFESVEAVLRRARRNPVVAPETIDLKHLAWLLHLGHLYVGGDTGPMHIAAAMGTPVVALFGGTDPAQHAPYQKPCEVLCITDERLTPKERLARITPEMAYDACVKLCGANRGDPSGTGRYAP